MAGDFVVVDPRKAELLARNVSADLVVTTTERVAMVARTLAPGTMKEHIRAVPSAGLGLVISDHPATVFVIYGTQPHVIVARNKKVLKFKIDGKDVFARMVHHPGTKANNFLWKALEVA
jgi:hypothetical protein